MVELDVKMRPYGGTQSIRPRQFRLVGMRNDGTGDYHLHFTNIGVEAMDASGCATCVFAALAGRTAVPRLKSSIWLYQLPTSKEHIVRILIYASILSLLVSNVLLRSMRDICLGRVFPVRRMEMRCSGSLPSDCWLWSPSGVTASRLTCSD